jgi:hypothetical protein
LQAWRPRQVQQDEGIMFNPTAVVIEAFVDELRKGYISTYTNLEPDYPGIIDYVGHMALELIANSDARITISVTQFV